MSRQAFQWADQSVAVEVVVRDISSVRRVVSRVANADKAKVSESLSQRHARSVKRLDESACQIPLSASGQSLQSPEGEDARDGIEVTSMYMRGTRAGCKFQDRVC
jgi:hypothetical protein